MLGSTTAMLMFARVLGSTLGATLFGVIVNQGLPEALQGQVTLSRRLPPGVRQQLVDAYHPAYLAATIVALCIVAIVAIAIDERPLRKSLEDPTPAEMAMQTD
jgi:hypothetical protein